MTSKKLLAVALAGALLLSSVAAAGVARSATANDPLGIAVENAGNDGATVTVTHDGSAVENASVIVEVTDDSSYAGAGTYATDEDGTVSLPEPEENVTVEITAEKDDAAGSATATLIAGEEDDEGDDRKPFGQMVSSFVSEMLDAGEKGGPLGQAVSDYVTSNNPGSENKPDHAGKPDDVGTQNNSTDEDGQQGPPEHAGNDGDGENDDRGNGNDRGHGDDRGDSDEETTTTTTES